MENSIFVSYYGMDEIGVPVLHSVNDELGFVGSIHHIMTAVVVEGGAYYVSIAAAEVPCLACVGLVVYEETAPSRSNWGGIVVERAIEVLPCSHVWV